jgi:hypothetical protein
MGAFDSINQTQPPATPFASNPEYLTNPALAYRGPVPPSSNAGTSSPIAPAVMGNQRPPAVDSAPQKTAFDAYRDERLATDANYQRELHNSRKRGTAGYGGAQTEELKAKYDQKYKDEWSKLSPDQRAEKSNNYVETGVIGKQNSVNTSRLDAANFHGQTANEKLNGIAAGTGQHSWDNNQLAQDKGGMAIQNLIAEKENNGVNPYTNEYVGIAPTKDITNGVVTDLTKQSRDDESQAGKIRSAMTGLAGRNQLPLAGAQAMKEQAQKLTDQSDAKYNTAIKYDDDNSKIIATPYGTVASKSGKYADYKENEYPNLQNSTNSASSGIADTQNQQKSGGTPIADMIAQRQNDELAGKNPADRYAGPTPPTNPSADQETEEQKRKRQQAASQVPAPIQAQQATPQSVASNT